MAVHFEFVSALICERILREADGVTSAIRIVDVFPISNEAKSIEFFVVVSLKAVPVPEGDEFRITLALVNPLGERGPLPEPPGQPFKLMKPFDDPSVPGGVAFGLHLEIVPKHTGTYYVEINLDGEIITRVPFTVRRLAAAS